MDCCQTGNFGNIHSGFYDSNIAYPKLTKSHERITNCYEVEYFTADGGTSFINNKGFPIHGGGVLFVPPGTRRHSILHFQAFYVHFNITDKNLACVLNKAVVFSPEKTSSEEIKNTFISIIKHSISNDVIEKMYVDAKLAQLIYKINTYTSAHASAYGENFSTPILKALSYIEENYNKKLTLREIAEIVHLSPVYFHNLFSKETGKPLNEYIIDKRLAAAKYQLSIGIKSLSEIALECGFSSQSYFNYVFKKHIHITPLEYRKRSYEKYML